MSVSRRGWLYGAAGALAATAGLGAAWWRHATGGGAPLGAEFWALRFDRPEGGQLVFEGLRGKPLLINFWATWCPPCVEELPLVDRFFRDHGANGWQVIGLAIDQPSAVRRFLERTPVSFPIGLAGLQGTDLIRQLGNPQGSLPFTLVVDRGGGVAARKIGQLDRAQLEAWNRAQGHG